ncbi:telomere-associated protein RIF1-like [Palaemon carinicauda]|uniref:telomere-associated protein RIF1-like n=1 Tax=Palaemon carinicauda TaxID=392227 RepID=UPI0035B5F1B8
MKEGTDLEELVEQFTARQVSVRLAAYRSLIQLCTGTGAMVKFNWSNYLAVKKIENVMRNIRADLSSDSEESSYDAAGACGCLLASGSFVGLLEEDSQRGIIEDLIKVLKEKRGKKVVVRTLWCISRSKFGTEIYQNKAGTLLEAVCDILKSETSVSAALEALQVIHTLVEVIPDIILKDIKIWFSISFRYVLHEAERVRSIVFIILHSTKLYLDELGDTGELRKSVVTCLAGEMHSKTCKKMIDLVNKDSTDILRGWRLIVQVLGSVLHKGTSLINDLLEIVEKGFKSSTPAVRIEAFRCWKALIDNFALDVDVLTHQKRLKLLLAPLKANNAKNEGIALEKLLVWWHLVIKLKKHAASQFDTVVLPLLKFCFSGTSPSSPGGQNIGLAQRNLMMSVAASPGRKYRGLLMLCAEVIAQILSAGINIPERQPFVFSISPLEEPLINDALFYRSLQLLFSCVGEVMNSLNDETEDVKRKTRQNAVVALIIQSIVTRVLRSIKSEGNKKESVEQVKEMFTLFSEIEHSCKPGTPLSEYVFKFYEIITTSQELALPLSVINSRQYNITGNSMQDMMSGTLSNHIIQQLCKPPLLHLATTKEEYFTVWITVLDNSKPSTGKLGFLQSIVKEIEGAETYFGSSHPDTLRRMWAVTVRQLLSYIEQTQIIDQGDGMEHDWICIYNMLLFPINQSVTGFIETTEEFNQKVMVDWSELWFKFTELTPLAATAEPNCEIEYIARGMISVYKRVIAASTSESFGIAYNLMANILLLLTQKVKFSELGKPSLRQVNSPAKPKKKSHPLCNLSGCVELFELLFVGLMRMGACPGRISTAQLLCESIINIFRGVHQEKLLNPLIAEVLPTLTEGFKINPFVRFNADVGKQFVKVVRSFSLMFEEHIGSAHTPDHINRLEPLLRLTLTSNTKEIKQAGRQLWKSSFSNTSCSIPSALYEVLKDCSLPPACLNDSQDDFEEFGINPKENVPDNVMAGSFLKRSGGVDSAKRYESPKSKYDSPKVSRLSLGSPRTCEKKRIGLQDMKDEDFVKVSSPKPSRRVLTEHQIEKFKERKDIPAMYSDLSQSASQIILPTQFASQHSFEESILSEASNSKKLLPENEKSSSKQLTFTGFLSPDKKDDKTDKTDLPSAMAKSTPVQKPLAKGKATSGEKSVGSEEPREEVVKIQDDKGGDVSTKSADQRSDSTKVSDIDNEALDESVMEVSVLHNHSDSILNESVTLESEVPNKKTQSRLKNSKEASSKNSTVSKVKEDDNANKSRSSPEVGVAVDKVKVSEMKENIDSPAGNPVTEGGARLRSVTRQGLTRKDSQDKTKVSGTPMSTRKNNSTPKEIVSGVRTRRSRGPGEFENLELCGKDTKSKKKSVNEVSTKNKIARKEDKKVSEPSIKECVVSISVPVVSGGTESKKRSEIASEISEGKSEKLVDSEKANLLTGKETVSEKDDVTSRDKGMKDNVDIVDADAPGDQILSDTAESSTGKTSKVKSNSNCDSDHKEEDLDGELGKTSVDLQKSPEDSPVDHTLDDKSCSDSNRRKSQTPSKKTVEDVRKVLKGRVSVSKSPSESSPLKNKPVSKSPSESSPLKNKPELTKSLSGSFANKSGVCVSKQEVDESPVVHLEVKKGVKPCVPAEKDVMSDSESEEPIPSSQEDDELLTDMAQKIAMSRLCNSENTVKDHSDIVMESEESIKETSDQVDRKAKRKRSLNDEIEEDVEQKLKKKKTLTSERENSGDDSLSIIKASVDGPEKSEAATPQKEGSESEKSNKLGRRSSNQNLRTPKDQNSCDLFEVESSLTTPPKVTRSGRKIVAPKKDMPEPLTPPGSSSGKKRKALEEDTIESPKATVSPSLLSNNHDFGEDPESETISQVEKSSSKKTAPHNIDLETVAKRNVQKKITDMFNKGGKEPVRGKATLPEMDKLENDLLEGATSVSDGMKNGSTNDSDVIGSKTRGKDTSEEENCNKNVEDELCSKGSAVNEKMELGDEVIDERISERDSKEITRAKSLSPLKKTLSPPKKRISLSAGSLELQSCNVENLKSVEMVTSVPESIDLEEFSSSITSPTTTSGKVLSPKKKWAQTAKGTEMAASRNEEHEKSKEDVSEEKNIVPVEKDLPSKLDSPRKERGSNLAGEELEILNDERHQQNVKSSLSPQKTSDTAVKSPLKTSEKSVESPLKTSGKPVESPLKTSEKSVESPLKTSEKSVESPLKTSEKSVESPFKTSEKSVESPLKTSEKPIESDDDSDMEVDVEMIDQEQPEKSDVYPCKSRKTAESVQACVAEEVIDISCSISPETRDKSEKTVVLSKESEKVHNIEADPEPVILSSNESKDGSDETSKSNSKSSDSSSLENAQRIDEELKEVDRKSIKSPKKDKVFKINAEEKQSEEESSPEKPCASKFTHTLGTPERQKKFGSLKYAGSRAAMLVACAKQNIKNRSNEGDSPSKLTVGDAVKNRLGHSPVRKSSARSVSPSGTPPTPSCKRKSNEIENGKPWVKHEPSPGATPSPSILKKSGVDETVGKESTSPPSKQRRVSFADPPVSDRVEIPASPKTLKGMRAQKRLDMTKADSPVKAPSSEPEDSQPYPDSPINVNCSQPIYSPLIDCKDLVDLVAVGLTSPFLFEGLKMVLEERGIQTVGQFCQLTEADIKQLPIRDPKVPSALKVLENYKETRLANKKGTDVLIENVEAQLSEIFGDDGEVQVDTRHRKSKVTDKTEESGIVLHSGLENEDLPLEDGITPLESTVEDVSCETINTFCKQLSENPQLLDVLVENLDENARQALLRRILVELPYGAVLDTYFEYLRKRDPPSSCP